MARRTSSGRGRRKPARPRKKRQASGSVDVAALLTQLGSRIPRSKFRDIASYYKAMTKDPWLAIGQIRVTQMLKSGKWQIVDERTNKPLPMGKDDAPRVVQLMKHPNRWYSFGMYINRLMIHRNIAGTVFQYRRPSAALDEQGRPVPHALWLLEPQRVELVPPDETQEDGGFYGGFKYRNGTKTLEIPAEDVDVLKYTEHTTDLYWGMGVVELGEGHFNITISMEEWIWSLFTNGIIPDGIITLPGKVSEEVFERYMKQLTMRFQGNRNKHKPLVLEQGGKYERTTTPEEADFEVSRKGRREETLSLQGVPPIRAGLTENLNFASAYISDAAFIRDTYLPTTRDLEEFLTENVTYRFGPYRFEFEKQQAVSDPAEITNRGQVGFGTGAFTPNDVRELFGKERIKNQPALDQHYLPFGVMAITGPGAETPAPPPPEAPAAPAAPPEGDTGNPATPALPAPFPEIEDGHGHERRSTALQRRILRFIIAERNRVTKAVARIVRAFFRWQMEQMIARLYEEGRALVQRGVDDVLNDAGDAAEWARVSRRFLSAAMKEEFDATAKLLGYQPDELHRFEPGSPLFEQRVNRMADFVTNVTDQTRDEIAGVLQEGLRQGRSVSELARGSADGTYPGIEGTFRNVTPWRSQLIARTEASRAYDQAATEVYKGLGVTMCDVIGCEDNVIMQGQKYGCNSTNIPLAEAEKVMFHPNHKGAIVPQAPARGWGLREAVALTAPDPKWDSNSSRLERLAVAAGLPETRRAIGAKG